MFTGSKPHIWSLHAVVSEWCMVYVCQGGRGGRGGGGGRMPGAGYGAMAGGYGGGGYGYGAAAGGGGYGKCCGSHCVSAQIDA